jgi:hypothetical protein
MPKGDKIMLNAKERKLLRKIWTSMSKRFGELELTNT